MALTFPDIDPVALHIGPIPYAGTLAIRWYSLAYIAGIMLGWWVVAREHARRPVPNLSPAALDDMVTWAVFGIVLGGRLGFVLFYRPDLILSDPLQILRIWQGGMSFHGGLLGVIIAFGLFCRKNRIRFFALMDIIACAAPIGLFFGRLANFVNGELYGRVSDVPWAMVFPHGGDLPRHPSQLYEASLEGALLFAMLFTLLKKTHARDKPGMLSGLFIAGYALARIATEQFREPDDGFMMGITMGQFLSVPMFVYGLYLITRRKASALP